MKRRTFVCFPTLALAWLSLLLAAPGWLRADERHDMTVTGAQCIQLVSAGRYAEAEAPVRRFRELADRVAVTSPTDSIACLQMLSVFYGVQGRFGDAAGLSEQALAIAERSFPPNDDAVLLGLVVLGRLRVQQGRYLQAESLLRRALGLVSPDRNTKGPFYVAVLSGLGILYRDQGRFDDAEPLFKEALAFHEAALGANQPSYFVRLRDLAVMYRLQGRYAEAEPPARTALEIAQKQFGPENPLVGVSLGLLAEVLGRLGRNDEATPLRRQAVTIAEKAFSPENPILVDIKLGLVADLIAAGHSGEAMSIVDTLIAVLDREKIEPANRSACYTLRSKHRWDRADRPAAIADLRQAMDLAEEVRAAAVGSEFDRARAFGGLGNAFELMVTDQLLLGNIGEAFAAAERGRARSLQDQLELTGVDLLRGLPPDEAARLRRLDREGRSRVTALQNQIDTLRQAPGPAGSPARQQAAALELELTRAKRDYLNVYREVRGASPAYRLAALRNRQAVGLEEIRQFASRSEALLLDYIVGQTGAFLIVIPPDGPTRWAPLVATVDQARILGTEPGPLNGPKLAAAFSNARKTGVFQRLQDPGAAAPIDALAALWQVLVPEPERQRLIEGRFKRLTIVPDGPLALLPFEALVVKPGDEPRYLLDLGPPICYTPSVGILKSLAGRPVAPDVPDREPVLSVGDPEYTQPDASAGEARAQRLSARSLYSTRGGRLSKLPFSGSEVRWVAKVFDRDGIKAGTLTGPQATEAAVRFWGSGRRVLHLACHGLVDYSPGNFFGALALTPGPSSAADPTNDGLLTMTELSELDLRTCELTILSACQTNFGPREVGEGVWALSRGFLVAGSRRVVASNWLVDDEATASLVSYFCAGLAQAEKSGRPVDHAAALQAARRWVRQQEKWKSPYYWASMVLIGPP